jgi:hypothetical protein
MDETFICNIFIEILAVLEICPKYSKYDFIKEKHIEEVFHRDQSSNIVASHGY